MRIGDIVARKGDGREMVLVDFGPDIAPCVIVAWRAGSTVFEHPIHISRLVLLRRARA